MLLGSFNPRRDGGCPLTAGVHTSRKITGLKAYRGVCERFPPTHSPKSKYIFLEDKEKKCQSLRCNLTSDILEISLQKRVVYKFEIAMESPSGIQSKIDLITRRIAPEDIHGMDLLRLALQKEEPAKCVWGWYIRNAWEYLLTHILRIATSPTGRRKKECYSHVFKAK